MPLSKLFNKRNSTKEKKNNAKPPDLEENKATSNSVNEDVQIESSSSKQPLSNRPDTDASFDKESKVLSEPAELLSRPKTDIVIFDSKSQEDGKNFCAPTEQSLPKAENIHIASSECYNEEVRKEDSAEQLSSTAETVSKISLEVLADNCTSSEQMSSIVGVNIQDTCLENIDCALIEKLPPNIETENNVTCALNKEGSMVGCISSEQVSSKDEDICDTSIDIKTEAILCERSVSSELLPLKAENAEDVLSGSTNEDTQSESCQSPELSQKTDELRHNVRTTKINNRSSSFKESGSKLNPPKSRRRKCESESAASNSTDDEGFDDKVLRFGVTDLEKMIGQCVNRLIRESIVTAVRSVNVDSLCDEVMRSISDRSQSESSSETVEQGVHTNSVIEYADLEMLDTFENGEESDCEAEETSDSVTFKEEIRQEMTSNQGNKGEGQGCLLEHTRKTVEDTRDTSGYHADCEESLSVHSMTIEIGNEAEPGETPSDNVISFGVISSGDNSKVSHSSSTNESVYPPLKQKIEEINKADVRNDIVDSSFEKDVGKVTKSDITNETVDCSLKEDSEEESKSDSRSKILDSSLNNDSGERSTSDITNETVDNPPKTDSEEQSKSYKNETGDSTLQNDTEDVKRTELTKETVENSSQQSSELSNKGSGMLRVDSEDLISMCEDAVPEHLGNSDQIQDELEESPDLGANLPLQSQATEEEKKVNWKAGYLHVKLPHKSRGKGHLKAWKKRCVSIQPDEFAHTDHPCLIVSVFSGSERKKGAASFWKSVSCQRAVLYRSSSSTQRYAFTLADEDSPVVHLAADSEADAQGWMAAMRAVLWPPSPVVELEKMLNGSQFEVSLIDNEFSYRAGLLGMYGHLTITQKKLILVHPQQGYVIQEWYLNTVDKFELTHQTRIEDVHKVLRMTTCSDSSTGKGDILIFCREAVALLQSLASTIHQILTYHSKQEGGKYQKELEEIAEWLVPSISPDAAEAEELYKVPPRQVRSLLDIPNFIFDKPLTPVASVACSSGLSMDSTTNKPLTEESKTSPSRASQDSGISAEAQTSDDFLNCSLTSFKVGGGPFHPGKSSDSELSDSYTPPMSPSVKVKHVKAGANA